MLLLSCAEHVLMPSLHRRALRPSGFRFPQVRRATLHIVATIALGAWTAAAVANPLSFVTETFSDWRDRLFGKGHPTPEVVDAPAEGVIALKPGQPVRLRIADDAPTREFAKGKSRYREIELPQSLEHAAVRVQVVAQRGKEHGNTVFKPLFYVHGDGDSLRDPVEVKPLHVDIRPFRKTRLLGCVMLKDVQRFAVATDASSVGKSYVSEVREAVNAPTQNGFYYTTDAIKARLPYAATGTLILEVTAEKDAKSGC